MTLVEKLQAWKAKRAEFIALRTQLETAYQNYLQLSDQFKQKAAEMSAAENDLVQE